MAEKKKFDFIAPFKGIPDVAKGLPKNLIAFWKEPVTNPDQLVERRASLWSALYMFACIAIVTFALGFIPVVGIVFTVLAYIAVVITLLAAFLLVLLKKIEAKFAALTCDNCGHLLDIDTKEQYDELVSYEVLSHDVSTELKHPASDKGVVSEVRVNATAKAVLKVTFKCPECGSEKSFKYVIEPMKAEIKETKVHVVNLELVKMNLQNAMQTVVDQYTADSTKVPYTIHSVKHPDNANKDKPQLGLGPKMNDVTIRYHRDVKELVEGFFIHNEINGSIVE